jgi:hypothetical protein
MHFLGGGRKSGNLIGVKETKINGQMELLSISIF